MFISHEEFNSIMNEAYRKGYDDGKIEGQREIMQAMLTPNDIRKAFNFPNIVKEKENE